MTKCQVCGSKSTVFLCREHIAELQKTLQDLPWWLERLSEAAVGQVRMSDGGRRITRPPNHLDGDATLASQIGAYPNERETDLSKARRQRAASTLRRLLATGGVNARASDLETKVRDTITMWMRHICDRRRADWVTFVERDHRNAPAGFIGPLPPGWIRGGTAGFIGPLLPGQFRRYTYPTVEDAAHWLAWNVNTIAATETAGECFLDFRGRTRAIERTINPPLGTRFLGKCPTWHDDTQTVCGVELSCREDAIEIVCPGCRKTHNVNRLQLLLHNDLERKRLCIADIIKLNRTLPEEYRVKERTLRHWRQSVGGKPPKLKPCGYIRPCSCGHSYTDHRADDCAKCDDCEAFDGREVITKHPDSNDVPLYLWSDITRLRAEKPERKAAAG